MSAGWKSYDIQSGWCLSQANWLTTRAQPCRFSCKQYGNKRNLLPKEHAEKYRGAEGHGELKDAWKDKVRIPWNARQPVHLAASTQVIEVPVVSKEWLFSVPELAAYHDIDGSIHQPQVVWCVSVNWTSSTLWGHDVKIFGLRKRSKFISPVPWFVWDKLLFHFGSNNGSQKAQWVP